MKMINKAIDVFIFPKRWNYILYWLTLGLIFFVSSELVMRAFQEAYYLELRASALILLVGLGIVFNFIRINFNNSITGLNEIIEFPVQPFEKWKTETDETLFTSQKPVAKIAILAICIFSISVMVSYGLPFHNTILNVTAVVSLIPLLIICGFGAYMLVHLMYVLSCIVKYPTNTPFYMTKHPRILELSSFFAKSSLYILACYAWLTFTIWLSPYKLEGIVLISIVIIGFCPLAMFLGSFFQIHSLLSRIKQKHIQTINEQIQIALVELKQKPSAENAELVSKLMAIQKNIEGLNDFPIAIGEVSTFFATLGIPILNAILSFRSFVIP